MSQTLMVTLKVKWDTDRCVTMNGRHGLIMNGPGVQLQCAGLFEHPTIKGWWIV